MGIVRKWLGPASKYDKSIPYIYEARVDMLSGASAEPIFEHYFSDTICGLVNYLQENGIKPSEVALFGVFRDQEIPISVDGCTDGEDGWLERWDICKSLETQYESTHDRRFKGHVSGRPCAYVDRDRSGH